MKKIFFLIGLIVISFEPQAQTLTFLELLDLYEQGEGRIIESATALKYFGFEPSDFAPRLETGTILLTSGNSIWMTSISPCVAGGICQNQYLTIFTKTGEILDKNPFEYKGGDCVSRSARRNLFASDTLLIFNRIAFEVDECEAEIEKVIRNDVQIEYVYVENSKFQRPIINKIDTRRKYFIASSEFLTQNKISKYSIDELSIIRNEIFAAHGYTFDTPKWQQYFGEQEWYEPVGKEVDNYLSMIERHNIQKLLKAERK